jgi:acyl-CoA reductase-like NAD-dependent aldehyde dehydrogenase
LPEPAALLDAALALPFTGTLNGAAAPAAGDFGVENPATGREIARCPETAPNLVGGAIEGAREAQARWARTSFEVRRELLLEVADCLEAHADELAVLITAEQGKPLSAARAECSAMARGSLEGFSSMDLSPRILVDDAAQRVEAHARPLGVVAAIIPWNFPIHTTIQKLAPALYAGNALIVKPSPYTPLATLRAMEHLRSVLPPGLVQTLAGGDALGQALVKASGIDKVSFTGSTPTGRAVMAASAPSLKHLTLELGGNDAGIVLADADPREIAPLLVRSAFNNSGQVCHALKRLYVPSTLHDALAEELVSAASKLKVGDGFDAETDLGPLANRAQFDIVCRLVEDARERGARVLCGGAPLDRPGTFYPPTLLTDCTESMALVAEEQFGPALPLLTYDEVDEAVARANASEKGLSGSVWTPDIEAGERVAARLECGTAWINQHSAQPTANHVSFPFGGVKASGIGRERGEEGLREYTQTQVINRRK